MNRKSWYYRKDNRVESVTGASLLNIDSLHIFYSHGFFCLIG